jgi:hypothetical protein
MGTPQSGRYEWVAVGIQSALSTVATVFTYFQPTDIGGFIANMNAIASDRRIGTRYKAAARPGVLEIPFNFTVEANPDDLGRLLMGALGTDTMATTATSVWTHTFTKTEELPYLTVYGFLGGSADTTTTSKCVRIMDAKIGKLTLRGGTNDIFTCAVEGIGRQVAALTAPTTTFPGASEDSFALHTIESLGLLKIGANIAGLAQFNDARSFEFVIDNGVFADHRINNSQLAAGVEEGGSAMTGQFEAILSQSTWTEILAFQAGTDRAIQLAVALSSTFGDAATSYKTLTIQLDKCRYTGSDPNHDPDVISVQMPFDVEPGTSMYVSLKTGNSLAFSATY